MTKLIPAIVFLIALLFFNYLAMDLPVLREMRGIIFYGGWIDHFSLWDEIARPTGDIGAGGRLIAMMVSALDARLCGFAPRCINITQATLLAIAATLLFIHLKQLLGDRWVAAILAVLWCLSLPALEGALWQATLLDKLAMSFSLAYLIVLFRFFRRPVTTSKDYIACNLALVLLLFFAFKSKEISFFLVPLTALTLLTEGAPEGVNGITSKASLAILPIGYGTFYLIHYLRNIPPSLQDHISARDPLNVLPALLRAMLGDGALLLHGNWGNDYRYLTAAAIAIMTLVIILAAISFCIARRKTAGRLDEAARSGIYLAGVLGCNLLILARTSFPHPYYLMIAEAALLGLIGLAVLTPIGALAPRLDALRRFGLLSLLGLAMVLGYSAQRVPGSATARIQHMGRRINDAFSIIRSTVPAEAITDAHFLFPGPIDGDWYFFGNVTGDGKSDPELLSFIYGKRVLVSVTYHYGSGGMSAPNFDGTMRVLWDSEGFVRNIELGTFRLFISNRS
jgi:hypothetical protein